PGDVGLQLIHAVGRHVLGRSVVDVALLEPEVVDRLLVPPPDRPLGVMLPKRLAQLGQMVRQGASEPDEMRYARDHAHPPWLLAGGGPSQNMWNVRGMSNWNYLRGGPAGSPWTPTPRGSRRVRNPRPRRR